jgi:hypothetical protein
MEMVGIRFLHVCLNGENQLHAASEVQSPFRHVVPVIAHCLTPVADQVPYRPGSESSPCSYTTPPFKAHET